MVVSANPIYGRGATEETALAGQWGFRVDAAGATSIQLTSVFRNSVISGLIVPPTAAVGCDLTAQNTFTPDGVTGAITNDGTLPAVATDYLIYFGGQGSGPVAGLLFLSQAIPPRIDGTYPLGAVGQARNCQCLGWLRTIDDGAGAANVNWTDKSRWLYNIYNRRPVGMFECPHYADDAADTSYALNSAALSRLGDGLSWLDRFDAAWPFDEPAILSATITVDGNIGNVTRGAIVLNIGGGAELLAACSIPNGTSGASASCSRVASAEQGFRTADLMAQNGGVAGTLFADFTGGGTGPDVPATYIVATVWL